MLNVYGYLENFGFGTSKKNETGIPWTLIRNAIHALTQQTQQSTYGGPLRFIQSNYIVDLSLLPPLPEDFRVGSDNVSLLDFITEVCEAGGCDFYLNMVETFTGIFVVQVNTVSRTAVINYGVITQFLAQFPEYEVKSVGLEFQNENMSKFLVGGNKRELWYQPADGSLNTVWPFWGFDINGNPIIGTGTGDDHQFTLDTRSVANPRVGPFYTTNVAEIRAVLSGRASWETFILFNQDNGGIHENKARDLNIIGYTTKKTPATIITELVGNYQANNGVITLDPGKILFPGQADNLKGYEQLDWETGYLYDLLFHVATEYYGRKFMVTIPYTLAVEEPDTGKIRLSQLPVESAYLDEASWPSAVANNLLPLEVDRFTEEDGKIISFVRFNNGTFLDLSELSQDSVGFSSNQPTYGDNKLLNTSVFVKCDVADTVVFLDKQTRFGPRAVISLDGVIRQRVLNNDMPAKDLIVKLLKDGFSNAKDSNGNSLGIDVTTPAFMNNVIKKFTSYIGSDNFNYGNETSAVTPDLAVVPLESQVEFYGPWYASGGAGRVDYEKDDTLVPWNYGGWTALGLAAESKVNQAIGTNFLLEQGDITFPEVPFHSLGQPLLFGGPIVSDISVSIGTDGAHTNYKFRRNVKQPRYGQAKAERVAQLSRRNQQIRRNIRLRKPVRRESLDRTKTPINITTRQDHPKNKKTSSHEVLVGTIFNTAISGQNSMSVFLQSDYNFTSHVQDNYNDKAYMSLDGFFTPFSTFTRSGYPCYVVASSYAAAPTVNDLNTFRTGTNIKMIAVGSGIPLTLFDKSAASEMRPLALRGPLVISGPAYSTDGYPVPNASSDGTSTEFAADYLVNQASWPTGPVDLRWDRERGVYVGGSSNSLVRATMTSFMSPSISNTATATLLNGEIVTVYNWLSQPSCSGDNIYLSKEADGTYHLVLTEFKPVFAMESITCVNNTFSGITNKLYIPGPYLKPSGHFSC